MKPAFRPAPGATSKFLFPLLLAATLLAGCANSPPAATAATPWHAATATNEWNDYANDLIARNQVGQGGALRTLAYLNLAIHNALVQARAQQQDGDGAVAGASATVLAQLFQKDAAAVTGRLDREVKAVGGAQRARFQQGVEAGRAVGQQVLAQVAGDRAGAPWAGTVPTGDGKWASQVQPAAAPLAPAIGGARTFLLASGSEFRAPPPPAWGSREFQDQVRQVKTVSDSRTNQQVRVAQYWENLTGSFAAGAWNQVARQAMAQRNFDEARTARALATMHMAGWDGLVACHDSKYVYWVPRPVQADPSITQAIGLPNHPSYPSNHACISGAMGRVLDAQLGDSKGQYEAMGKQAGDSRLYAGIHYPMDMDAGNEIARKIASRAAQAGPAPDKPFMPLGK